MKKNIAITTAVAGALIAAGCNQQPTYTPMGQPSYLSGSSYDDDNDYRSGRKVCTDKQKRRVEDSKCSRGGGGIYTAMFLRAGSPIPAYGTAVNGGSYSRPSYRSSGYSTARPSTSSYSTSNVSRGGFGSSASSYSSGSGS